MLGEVPWRHWNPIAGAHKQTKILATVLAKPEGGTSAESYHRTNPLAPWLMWPRALLAKPTRGTEADTEFIDYKTSMISEEDPLRGLLFC